MIYWPVTFTVLCNKILIYNPRWMISLCMTLPHLIHVISCHSLYTTLILNLDNMLANLLEPWKCLIFFFKLKFKPISLVLDSLYLKIDIWCALNSEKSAQVNKLKKKMSTTLQVLRNSFVSNTKIRLNDIIAMSNVIPALLEVCSADRQRIDFN